MRNSRSMLKNLLLVTGLGFGVSMMSGDTAEALTATDNITVSANVVSVCSMVGGALAFGNYDPSSATDLTGSATFTVNCSAGAPIYITLDQGAHPASGSTAAAPLRTMDAGTATPLSYNLYQDAGFSTVWGDTVGTAVNSTGTGAAQTLTVYGSIPNSQAVLAGSYTDTVLATVNY